jgi:cell division protein FtsZ
MKSDSDFTKITFDLPKNQSNVIKVIGVGGGGSNAINHMFKQGIKGVDFIVCNTDSQALENSSVPNKIQLGVNLTEGLGAGANPEVGHQSAIESVAEIEKMLDSNTKMVFITAGMGGGTGTGAAPVIAQLAKERDILTVGIVTIPFQFEGKVRMEQALLGVERLRKQVDSLIVINNNKLREVYGNLGFKAGYSKADEVLSTASRGIAEVITHHYTQNIDLKDAKTVLSNSGTAIMGSSTASGEHRAIEAIRGALDSPLLNDNKIAGAKNVLLLIVFGTDEITFDEIGEITDYIQAEAGNSANIIMGAGEDETLGNAITVTIIATGFNAEQQSEIVNIEQKKIIHSLEDDQKLTHNLTPRSVSNFTYSAADNNNSEKLVHNLVEEEQTPYVQQLPTFEYNLVPTTEFIKNIDVTFEIVSPKTTPEFSITIPEVKEIIAPEIKAVEMEQISFSFDFPLPKKEDIPVSEVNQIEVNQAIHLVPVTEVGRPGVIRHSLEEYMEVEKQLVQSKPIVKEEEVESYSFSLKKQEPIEYSPLKNLSPTEMSIDDAKKLQAEDRRKKLKEFNHKFHNLSSRSEDAEKEPAYKRHGIELNDAPSNTQSSRYSVGVDANGEQQLRSNNSFLHDNVD